uniref:Uncharacterized protein n=1 Tax=Picea glauca TaxID=3330 RepID=A0A101LZ45_PICGL|nr:hypothetical protein ABT39_MTgene5027 [Picea glauca]
MPSLKPVIPLVQQCRFFPETLHSQESKFTQIHKHPCRVKRQPQFEILPFQMGNPFQQKQG